MKRTLSILLIIILLLTFAGCGNKAPASESDVAIKSTTTTVSTEGNTESAATPTENDRTVFGLTEADVKEKINAFFEGMKTGDVKALQSELWNDEAAKELANAVKLTDYTLTPQEEENGEDEMFRYVAHLTVEKSTLDRIPTGESDWVVWYGMKRDGTGMYLCPVGENIRAQYSFRDRYSWTPDLFCYQLSTIFDIFDTLNLSALSPQELSEMDDRLMTLHALALWSTCRLTRGGYRVPPEELAAFTETTFGVSGVDFTESQFYHSDSDTMELLGKGGRWTYAIPVSIAPTDDRYTVVIRYYADALCLLEAATMRYEVQRDSSDYRLLSCEKISGSRDVLFGSI